MAKGQRAKRQTIRVEGAGTHYVSENDGQQYELPLETSVEASDDRYRVAFNRPGRKPTIVETRSPAAIRFGAYVAAQLLEAARAPRPIRPAPKPVSKTRSRKPEQRSTLECPVCGGTGNDGVRLCDTCEGDGLVDPAIAESYLRG